MSGFQTVLVGVVVLVLGQSIQRFILEPMQEQRRIIGEIASSLLFLGNIGPPPASLPDGVRLVLPEEPEQASRTLRSLASRLRATLWTIPLYNAWAAVRVVPHRDVILGASRNLVSWSNSLHSGQPDKPRRAVAELLKLPGD